MTFFPLQTAYDHIMTRVDHDLAQTPYDQRACRDCPVDHLCCYDAVRVSYVEALMIAHHLQETKTWHLYKDTIHKHREMIKAAGTMKLDHVDERSRNWNHRQIRCTFYNTTTRQCMVYHVRPLACRVAYGLQEPPCSLDGGYWSLQYDSADTTLSDHTPTAHLARLSYEITQDIPTAIGELNDLVYKAYKALRA